MAVAVSAEGLVKRYGEVTALDGVDLEVPEGTVLSLLGPNGAGKTTTVRILATLLQPDAGSARVAGVDVLADPAGVRRRIGLSGQYAAVDEYLTGYENLEMFGRLYKLGKAGARARAQELLERFSLTEAAHRPVKTYSGGMRRRLDLAGALVATPPVLFLDEPTTGLDPRSRLEMWEVIAELVRSGVTLLLTTQYLEEADRLADSIAVVDRGRVIARGTADELKARLGGDTLEVVVDGEAGLAAAEGVLRGVGTAEPVVDRGSRRVSVAVGAGPASLLAAVRELDDRGVALLDVGLHRPSLDDVFLALTGRAAGDDEPSPDPAPAGREHEEVRP
ncbi:ATP-binding cassette domain-containing protein [Vallicoccus soli]|uniref:ATP-binding cassette domain-containing protein n=1 Tax=Vallicoccus soli TaxID=2339232 RepID=A0A3A3Z3F5_9ACTN|nr:ATP-binding cassette domain-containing protein [Vallicoccus soli]RJK97944.1 ATP-binding cassette domain-containing protein [Vallicoccus soli]